MTRALAMAACISALIAATNAHAQSVPREAAGRCQYPDAAKDYAAETTFIACDGVAVEDKGQGVVLNFLRKGWGQSDRFYGQVHGGDIRISRVALRKAEARDAQGTCRLTYRTDGRLSVASCLVKSRARWIAANFVASGF
ncbi:hypothetical protein OKA06_04650 [Novosphingobium sp. MW5]|nr:hypothetical protein [Novosphingobium sp. MW5]